MALKVLYGAVAAYSATGSLGQNMRGSEAAKTTMQPQDALVDGVKGLVLPWMRDDEWVGAKHVHVLDAAMSLEKGVSLEGTAKLEEYRVALKTFFQALPKDSNGRLEVQTARYALHRFFVQQHSWTIKGLNPNTEAAKQENSANAAMSNKEWLPGWLLSDLTNRVGHPGYTLEDLAALANAIDDLIRKEATGILEEVFTARGLEQSVSREDMHRALKSYLVIYLGNGAWSMEKALTEQFFEKHDYWNATEQWMKGVEATPLSSAGEGKVEFSTAATIASDLGQKYGPYNDAECQKIKNTLTGAWSKGTATGRVRLVDFYRLGFQLDEFNFAEKPDFLRSMGALDDSNASSPMVIIPNYVQSMPNCLQATSIYSICCRNECEDLMTELEKAIAAPTAKPEQIAAVVRSLSSQTVSAPREIPAPLMARLEDMAARHGGDVNIHGRLFDQWMHHAYPSECPFPHEAGKAEPVTSEKWANEDLEASEEERRAHIDSDTCGPEQAAAEYNADLPWSDMEELVSSEAHRRLDASGAADRHEATCFTVFLVVAALGAAVVVALMPKEKHQELFAAARYYRHGLLLSLLVLGALALNVVNRLLIVFIVSGGLLVRLISTSPKGVAASKVDKEKCFV